MRLKTSLALLKHVLNKAVSRLAKATPKPKDSLPVCKQINRIQEYLEESMRMHPGRFYADHNFPKLVKTTCKILKFIAEEDSHYAGQLAQVLLLTHDVVHESRSRYAVGSRGDVAWIQDMSRQTVEAVKPGK